MLECPYDRSPMVPIPFPQGTEYTCRDCAGVWLPGHLVQLNIGTPPVEQILAASTQHPLRCPDDGQSLRALHHHGVEIDICTQCSGVWLDANEHAQIQNKQAQANRLSVENTYGPQRTSFDMHHHSPVYHGQYGSHPSSSDSGPFEDEPCNEADADVEMDANVDADFDLGASLEAVGPLLEGVFEFIGGAFSALDSL